MKETDKISVLVCAHSTSRDYDALLYEALGSLEEQKFKNFETVLVLDECWDPTKHMRRLGLENLKIIERSQKEGLARAKNFGLQYCTGDWVSFLDADDLYAPCKLNIQRDFLLINPHVDVCGTLAWDLDRTKDYYEPSCFRAGQYETHSQIEKQLRFENIMCHGSMMIRRSALDQVGGYVADKSMLGKEDWATWINLLDAGYTFHNIPERLYYWSCNTSVER